VPEKSAAAVKFSFSYIETNHDREGELGGLPASLPPNILHIHRGNRGIQDEIFCDPNS